MNVKLQVLEINGTWSILSLPPGKHPVGCKWVYKIKFRADGTVKQHKARLVAKGNTQQEGIDFLDTFSPIAKLVIAKILLSLATIHGWSLTQLDVTNIFFHVTLLRKFT